MVSTKASRSRVPLGCGGVAKLGAEPLFFFPAVKAFVTQESEYRGRMTLFRG